MTNEENEETLQLRNRTLQKPVMTSPTVSKEYERLLDTLVAALASRPAATAISLPAQNLGLQVPKFSGRIDESAQEFVSHLDRIALQLGWNQQTKLSSASGFLPRDSTAFNWNQVVGATAKDWDAWKVLFLSAFPESKTKRQLEDKMKASIQHLGEPIQSYIYAKLELCRKCGMTPTTAGTTDHILSGMVNRIHSSTIRAMNKTTVDEIIKTAMTLEESDRIHAVSSQRQYQISSNPFVSTDTPSQPPFVPVSLTSGNSHQPTSRANQYVANDELQRSLQAEQARSSRLEARMDQIVSIMEKMQIEFRQERESNRQPDGPATSNSSSRPSSRRPPSDGCHYCGRTGHFIRECRTRLRDEHRNNCSTTPDQAQRSGNYQSGNARPGPLSGSDRA